MIVQRSTQSEIGNLRRFQLKLQFVSDKRNKFGSQEIAICIGVGKSGKMPRKRRKFIAMFVALMLSCLLSCFSYSRNRKPAQVLYGIYVDSCSPVLSVKRIKCVTVSMIPDMDKMHKLKAFMMCIA